MEEIVYKFLDDYLGDKVDCIQQPPSVMLNNIRNNTFIGYDTYSLCSKKNNTPIIVFTISHLDGEVRFDNGKSLIKLLCDFFLIKDYDAVRIMRNWFSDRHNINKVIDLIKFIPYTTPSKLTSFG